MKITGAIILVVLVLKFLTYRIWPDFEVGLGMVALVWIPLIALFAFFAGVFLMDMKSKPVADPNARKDEPREP